MVLSKVNAPHPAPWCPKLVPGHRGTGGPYHPEQQVHWGQEWGTVSSLQEQHLEGAFRALV